MKNSRRTYKVQESQNGNIDSFTLYFKDLFFNVDDFETVSAFQEIIDEVLDLKINDSLYFQPNRDDNNSKAIITRVS